MKSVHFITFLFLLVTITGCLPDSLTKWDAEEPNTIVSPSTVSIQVNGEEVQVGEATGGTAPAAIQLSATVGSREVQEFSSENELSKNKVNVVLNESFSLAPSFEGETDSSNSYYFSLSEINASGEKSRFDYSLYDLKFDSKTGVLSGEPEKYIPSKKLSLDAYHVESGSWLSLPFNFVAATSFDIENAKVYYPISKDYDSYYIIEVDDISSFNVCKSDTSSSPCITSDNGITAFVEHINEDEKKLFLTITNTLTNDLPEHETLEDALTIDNSNDFVSSDANIVSVTRIFKRCVGTDSNCSRKLVPKFNFSLNAADNELAALEWSITPIPNGGIATNNSPFETEIGFIEESTGEDSGSIIIPNKANELAAKEFTVNVKNPLGETLTTKINLSITQAPSNLGVGNLYLLTLDETNEFRIGNYISSNNPSNARGKVIDKIGSNQLAIQLLNGDLNTGDHVDLLKKFSRKRGVVLHKTLFNAVLTVDDSLETTSLNENDPQKNEYRNIISQDHLINENSHPQDFAFQSHGVIKGKKSSITSITVYGGAHQFSPGLQVVQMGEGSSCENGDGIPTTGAVGTIISIGRNPYGGPGDKTDKDENIFINVLSGTFQKNKPIQIGGSYYDCTTTSVDMVKFVSNNLELSQVFVLASGESQFSISNPNEIPDELKINSGTTSDKRLISVWSPNVSFKSINEAGKWYVGDDISTRSHIPGKINSIMPFTEIKAPLSKWHSTTPGFSGEDEVGQIISAEFNQIGFLFASFDTCNDVDFTDSSACRSNSSLLTDRNAGRGDQGDGDPEFIFSKGNIYNVNSVMNMSSYNVGNKNFEDNGNILEDGSLEAPFRSRDDPQIKELKTTHHYTFYTREPMVLKSELQYGDEVVYELTPKWLPEGLEFDAKTGTLSGIPTEFVVKTNYTITAKNPIGEASSSFSMEIKDHFSVSIPMSFIDAESYILHQSGQGNQSTNCRITADQIEGNNQEVKDILCHLEAGEMDLYFLGLQLQYNIGPSMCEFVSFDPYTTYNTKYPYIKTGTVGKKNGNSYDLPIANFTPGNPDNVLNTDHNNVENGVKISRVYEYDDSCKKCMDPETGDILDCNDANFPREPAGGNHCASDYRGTPFDKNCDDGSFKKWRVIIGADDQEIPTSDGDVAKLKDGICGYKSGVLAPNNGSNSTKLTYQSFKFSKAFIDKNSDGKANASDDFGGAGTKEITGNGTTWNNPPAAFDVPCSVGTENSITYRVVNDTNELEIEFELSDAGGAGDACSAEDVEGNSVGNRVTYPLIRVVGSFPDTKLREKDGETNTTDSGATYNYWFVATSADNKADSIVTSSAPDTPDWTTLATCGQCKDINGDGEIDFVDFNSDGIADDIYAGTDGTTGPDGIGDHTFASRIDATESEIDKSEPVQLCNGDPRLCLDGSSELITSHDFDNESAIRGFELNSVYGVEAETFTFDAPANRFEDNSKLANYSAENSCGLNPRIIHQNSIFHDADSDGNYSDDTKDVLTSTFLQSNAGAALLFAKTGLADTFTTLTDESLFFELFASYDDENFYKGLGDLIHDDFKVLVDDVAQNGGANPGTEEEDDFSPSVTLPYVYKKTFDDRATTEGDMDAHPMLGMANNGVKYQLVSIQSAYDPDAKKSEITYFDNGFKNLANLARNEIIRMPVSFNHNNNLRGILVKGPDNNEEGIVINQDNVKNTVDIILTKGSKASISNGDQWTSSNGVDSLSTVNVYAIDSGSKGLMPIQFANYNFGSAIYKTKPYYTFNCLDAARDLKARIRLEVRDWDRVFTAGHDIDKAIPSSLMDDSSIDLWDEDFNNRADGDGYGARTLNSCLINYPTNHTPADAYNELPSPP